MDVNSRMLGSVNDPSTLIIRVGSFAKEKCGFDFHADLLWNVTPKCNVVCLRIQSIIWSINTGYYW